MINLKNFTDEELKKLLNDVHNEIIDRREDCIPCGCCNGTGQSNKDLFCSACGGSGQSGT